MGYIKSLNKWANAHTYYPLDMLRIALGIFLFYKGVYFMSNLTLLIDLIEPVKSVAGDVLLVHYIAPAHFVGGFLIVVGLLTRWASIAQVPILLGAILTNFLGEMNTTNLILAIVAFLVCIFFIVYGSGKHSADYYLKMQKWYSQIVQLIAFTIGTDRPKETYEEKTICCRSYGPAVKDTIAIGYVGILVVVDVIEAQHIAYRKIKNLLLVD